MKLILQTNEGMVIFQVDKMRYIYNIDTAFYPEIQKLNKFNAGKVLNLLKQKGTLIEKESI